MCPYYSTITRAKKKHPINVGTTPNHSFSHAKISMLDKYWVLNRNRNKALHIYFSVE